ncbi:heparan-alpha-glucosaminide N-acetyltransferase domain-containing protein [Nocardioides sp.]|uniref:heparan-alpha-glucosaminide N-acetyltransferase domain-containing protein n=1 Tax=Nocardioides sp. TaxID=35761 RepID=UPI003510EFE8
MSAVLEPTSSPAAPAADRRRRPSGSLAERWRALAAPPRIVGLDVARALAVIGMVGAHLGGLGNDQLLWWRPSTWETLARGYPSILFALLAGISLALLSGRDRPPSDPDAIRRLRLRLVGRGAAIFALGAGLELLGTPVAVVLGLYGVVFVIAPLFVLWTTPRLLAAAAGLALLGPLAVAVVRLLSLGSDGPSVGLVLGYFPITVWLVPVLIGIAVGRAGVTRAGVLRATAVGGVLLVAAGRLLATLTPAAPDADPLAAERATSYLERVHARGSLRGLLHDWLAAGAHSGGLAEILDGTGAALVVVALCVVIGRRAGVALVPLAALGTLPLTGYAAHLLVVSAVMGGPGGSIGGNAWLWAGTALGLVVGCLAWALLAGQGPLERWVARVAARFAS